MPRPRLIICFGKKNVNVSELREKLMGRVMYGSELVDADAESMTIKIEKGAE